MYRSVPPGRNTNDTGPKSVEHYITQANRQNLPFESPMSAFFRAQTAIMNRHDARHIEQKEAGILPRVRTKAQVKADMHRWEQECRENDAVYHYQKHFTDRRGNNTVSRANIVSKKA